MFSKTPLRANQRDENSPTLFGRKSGKGKEKEYLDVGGRTISKLNRNAFVTPSGPRARAPLGMKTTNAKATVFPNPAVPILRKDPEKSQLKPTSTRRPKKVTHTDTIKLEIHADESPLSDREVEYCPPKPDDIPYESDNFPNNCLDYSRIRPEKLWSDLKRCHSSQNYGMNMEKEQETAYLKEIKETDEIVQNMLKEKWSVEDVPETLHPLQNKHPPALKGIRDAPKIKVKTAPIHGPTTLVSRRAASALTNIPNPSIIQPKKKAVPKSSILPISRKTPASTSSELTKTATMRHIASIATSKSTIGYSKGRKVPGILHNPKPTEQTLTKSISGISFVSDTTITPERFIEEKQRCPYNMKAFEVDTGELEAGLRGIIPSYLGEDEEEFYLTLQS